MKRLLGLGVVLALGLGTAEASAQTSFGDKGDFGFAIERAMGLYTGRLRTTTPGPGPTVTTTRDATAVELGLRGNTFQPSAMTRIGFDFFVIDKLSLGGGIGYASYGDDLDASVFLFSPRVGYFLAISRHVGFWPRGGFTYYNVDMGGLLAPEASQLMFTAEGMFTFAPNEHFAFLLGPVFDLGFAGGADPGDLTYRDRLFGLSFGVAGLF